MQYSADDDHDIKQEKKYLAAATEKAAQQVEFQEQLKVALISEQDEYHIFLEVVKAIPPEHKKALVVDILFILQNDSAVDDELKKKVKVALDAIF